MKVHRDRRKKGFYNFFVRTARYRTIPAQINPIARNTPRMVNQGMGVETGERSIDLTIGIVAAGDAC